MIKKCKKVINVMKCLSGRKWGASRSSLKTIFLASIRSVLDYGCMVYGSAVKSLLGKLDVMQARALRICCGAIRTSPVATLKVEMGEMPFGIRTKQLMANYWVNLKGHNESHPTKEVLWTNWNIGKYKQDNLGRIGNEIAQEMGVFDIELSPTVVIPVVAPWMLNQPYIDEYKT